MIHVRSTIYWRIWFLLVLIYFLGILFNIPIIRAIPFIPYFVFIFLAVGFLVTYLSIKLLKYLENNYHEKWKELTSIPFFGVGLTNSFRVSKFIKSAELSDDLTIIKMKENLKSLQLLLTITYFSLPIFSIILLVLYSNNIITTWPFRSIFE